MPLPREHLLDELATAYVQIVAAAAGAVIAVGRDYGVDGTLNQIVRIPTISGTRFVPSGFPVDFQLKGTTTAQIGADRVQYDLQARAYDLVAGRPPEAALCCLFLVCFENEPEYWFALRPSELILRASAFWWREAGSRTPNSSTVRIRIPIENQLTPLAIERMLQASKERFEG